MNLLKPFSTAHPKKVSCLLVSSLVLLSSAEISLDAKTQAQTPPIVPASLMAQTPLSTAVLYVDPAVGQDGSDGSLARPLRTIAAALQRAKSGTTVKLAAGTYSQQTGETFPLIIPEGVILQGDEVTRGQTTVITGSGYRISPTFAGQNMTLWVGKTAQVRGVTVTNKATRGTGIWIESANPPITPTIENCTLTQNNREGIFVTGTANPIITNNVFTVNGGNGIAIANNAKGRIESNLFQNTGFGLALSENAQPIVIRNQIVQNVDGLYINGAARPLLRGNLIANNQRDGIVFVARAKADLGIATDSGNNVFRDNGQYDINNGTPDSLASFGNTLDIKKIAGRVDFSGLPEGSPTGQPTFSDIQGNWAQAYIEALAKRNVISGFPGGVFLPNDRVTRVQYAAIISRAFSPAPRRSRIEFKDVNASFWGYPFIQTAVQGGFMSGYPEGDFRPDQPIPRVQVLVALASGLNYGNGSSAVLSRYQDASGIPTWANGYVSAATQRQVVVNYPTLAQLNPMREATRAEVAAIVYQALVNAGKAEAIPSPYIVKVP
jgi:parallel beta-helix repeat protein